MSVVDGRREATRRFLRGEAAAVADMVLGVVAGSYTYGLRLAAKRDASKQSISEKRFEMQSQANISEKRFWAWQVQKSHFPSFVAVVFPELIWKIVVFN